MALFLVLGILHSRKLSLWKTIGILFLPGMYYTNLGMAHISQGISKVWLVFHRVFQNYGLYPTRCLKSIHQVFQKYGLYPMCCLKVLLVSHRVSQSIACIPQVSQKYGIYPTGCLKSMVYIQQGVSKVGYIHRVSQKYGIYSTGVSKVWHVFNRVCQKYGLYLRSYKYCIYPRASILQGVPKVWLVSHRVFEKYNLHLTMSRYTFSSDIVSLKHIQGVPIVLFTCLNKCAAAAVALFSFCDTLYVSPAFTAQSVSKVRI